MRARAAALLWLGAFLAGAAPASPEEDARQTHQVRPGETLSHVALYVWGDPSLWPAIYLANRDQIKDPAVVYAGQRLTIPHIDPAQKDSLRREAQALNSKPIR